MMTEYTCYIRTINNKKEYGFTLSGSWILHLGFVFDGGNGCEIHYRNEKELLDDGWKID